jgi:tRNA pseudouridine55 synthase
MEAIFNVYKPLGVTSHQVVDALRKASGEKRVGHAGTLDPAAEGVLLVCTGGATRLTEYLMSSPKVYCAEICIGVSTSTYDGEGSATTVASTGGITPDEILVILKDFVGIIWQRPPAYSALKRNGVPLYRLARQGQDPQAPLRHVTISELRFVSWCRPLLRVLVCCSPGTYIRSIAHDLGERLGCGAHLSHLVRLASGRFAIDGAVDLSVLIDAIKSGCWNKFAMHPDEALLDKDALVLMDEDAHRFTHGADRPVVNLASEGHLARTYTVDGQLLGLAQQHQGRWWPHKVLV